MVINGTTKIYGIVGNPVAHSLSPVMHNAAFAERGENRAYVPFPVEDIDTALQGIRGLHIEGASITIPHKETVIPYLDRIDAVAAKIGAVNTIVCEHHNGKRLLCGYNTDWLGAVRPLRNLLDLTGTTIVLLGAGGSARAIGFGLLEEGAEVVVCSRTESRGRSLAEDLGCPWRPLDAIDDFRGRVLINATSVGMGTQQDMSPVPAEILPNFAVVMDIVYAPLTTRLLTEAQQCGCTIINGLEMLLYQGAAQFELWTGRRAPLEVMRRSLLQAISADSIES